MFEDTDGPIVDAKDDKYGFKILAEAIAKSIVENDRDEGTVLSIYGKWGSGKSSLINIIESKLPKKKLETVSNSDNEESQADSNNEVSEHSETKEDQETFQSKSVIVTRFNCWWFQGEKALISEFFRQLYSVTNKSNDGKLSELIKSYGSKVLINFAPVFGAVAKTFVPPAGEIVEELSESFGKTIADETNIDEQYQDLIEHLKSQGQRYVVIVDDIDRLLPQEAYLIFKLIKTVGHLPYFTYILAYDRSIANQILKKYKTFQDITFLEKFVQAGIDVPHISQLAIKSHVDNRLRRIVKDISVLNTKHFKTRYRNLIAPLILTPRNVTRVCNVLRITWQTVKNQLDFADFVAVETLRILQPKLYHTIRLCKDQILDKCNINDLNLCKIEEINSKLVNLEKKGFDKALLVEGLHDLFTAYTSFDEYGGEIGLNCSVVKFREAHHLIGSTSWFDQYFQYSPDDLRINRPTQYLFENIEDSEQVKVKLDKIIEGYEKFGRDDIDKLRDFFEEIAFTCVDLHIESQKIVLSALISVYKRIRKIIVVDHRDDQIRSTFINFYWQVIQQMSFYSTQEELNAIESEKLKTILDCAGNSNFEFVFDFAYVVYHKPREEVAASHSKSKLRYLYDESNRNTLFQKVGELAAKTDFCDDIIDPHFLRDTLLFMDKFLDNEPFKLACIQFSLNMENEQFLKKFLLAFAINVEKSEESDFDDEEYEIEWEDIGIFLELDGVTDRLQRLVEQEGLEPEIKFIAEKVLRGRDA